MHCRAVWVAVVVLLALPLISGAQQPPNTYTGCLNERVGTVTQIAIGNLPLRGTCPRQTVMIHWSQQGPPGIQGPQGEQGPAGPGDITAVLAGPGLTEGGEMGDVTLALDTASTDARYAQLAVPNMFTADQSLRGTLEARAATWEDHTVVVHAVQGGGGDPPTNNSPTAVWGEATATTVNAIGVKGTSLSGTGMVAIGKTRGLRAWAEEEGIGVLGEAMAETGSTIGVQGIAHSEGGSGGSFHNFAGGRMIDANSGVWPNLVGRFTVLGDGTIETTGDVKAEGDVVLDRGKGIILRSPNSEVCHRFALDDVGSLVSEPIPCP